MLETEVRFHEEQRSAWATQYPGKYVLVKGSSLVEVFDSLETALAEGARRFGADHFLVRATDERSRAVSIPALALGAPRADPPQLLHGE